MDRAPSGLCTDQDYTVNLCTAGKLRLAKTTEAKDTAMIRMGSQREQPVLLKLPTTSGIQLLDLKPETLFQLLQTEIEQFLYLLTI